MQTDPTTQREERLKDDDFRYGQLAIEGRLITPEQFDAAMTWLKEKGQGITLREVLVRDGILDERTANRMSIALQRVLRDERDRATPGNLGLKQIGGYKILKHIGEGGMGEVYLAEQLNMHRQVALKVLHDKWADDEEFRKRFLLEARAAGKLSHQHLIQVIDVNKYQGKYYFSMEFVDGVTVEDMIENTGPMPVDKAIDITLQVCEALKYLSSHDIVHRDIKPANIMLTKAGVVKLGDFGFIQSIYDAELLKEGTTLGTPDYISPEQARGERNLTVRSDIYSLGATMFHMLVGAPPFTGSCSKVMRDHIQSTPPVLSDLRRDVPPPLRRVLAKMLAKDPADRHQSAEEVIRDLQMCRLDNVDGTGALPSTRSQILNVISAEKERIEELEEDLVIANRRQTWWAWLAMAGWLLAAILAGLLAIR